MTALDEEIERARINVLIADAVYQVFLEELEYWQKQRRLAYSSWLVVRVEKRRQQAELAQRYYDGLLEAAFVHPAMKPVNAWVDEQGRKQRENTGG